MKTQLRKWLLRLTASALLIKAILLIILLNPSLSYAHETSYHGFTIYHNTPLHESLKTQLDKAKELVKTSELYNPAVTLDICLNDRAVYPELMQKIQGPAFAYGVYNKVVLRGNANYEQNYVELNGYHWNLTQLLAHEMIHCFQFDNLGLLKSNPIANHPQWKYEGYAEYIARQVTGQSNLENGIAHLLATEKTNHNDWVELADGTGTAIFYYKARLMVQYCAEVKGLSHGQLLADTTSEEKIYREMMDWYFSRN